MMKGKEWACLFAVLLLLLLLAAWGAWQRRLAGYMLPLGIGKPETLFNARGSADPDPE